MLLKNTPYGSLEKYFEYYQRRTTDPSWQSYGLNPEPVSKRFLAKPILIGFFCFQENYGSNSGDVAANTVMPSLVGYKLGQAIYISNLLYSES